MFTSAFAFLFLEFKGKGIFFAIVMATMMVPGEATIISNYLTVGNLGMLDTYGTYCALPDFCNGNFLVSAVLYDFSDFII